MSTSSSSSGVGSGGSGGGSGSSSSSSGSGDRLSAAGPAASEDRPCVVVPITSGDCLPVAGERFPKFYRCSIESLERDVNDLGREGRGRGVTRYEQPSMSAGLASAYCASADDAECGIVGPIFTEREDATDGAMSKRLDQVVRGTERPGPRSSWEGTRERWLQTRPTHPDVGPGTTVSSRSPSQPVAG